MADHTGIEWADATWNPIVGCSVVSPGCTNCYAMGMAARLQAISDSWHKEGTLHLTHYAGTTVRTKAGAVWSGKLMVAPEHVFTQPLRWRRPRRIFVNSMGDLFHEGHHDEAIDHVFAVMALAPQHTYMVLTKRSARMRAYLSDPDTHHRICVAACDIAMELDLRVILLSHPSLEPHAPPGPRIHLYRWPLPNVWLGVSTEDQRRANERVPNLLATPAAIRFVSAEPLLGPLNLFSLNERRGERGMITDWHDALRGFRFGPSEETAGLDLVIAGGESGPKARPMHPDWVRSLRDQCAAAGTAFFFKQWGEWRWAPDKAHFKELIPDRWTRLASGCEGVRPALMVREGKRAAGRLLDGIEHNAMPEAR